MQRRLVLASGEHGASLLRTPVAPDTVGLAWAVTLFG